jgi:copper homeostasis protein
MIFEICAGSINSAIAAQEGGADRIELCSNLAEGGTTPGPSMIVMARKYLSIPLFVLIRPRPGDFLYNDLEFLQMQEDIRFCKKQRAQGVVLGILKPDGTVDMDRNAELIRIAHPMQVTFHRAIDMTRDPFQALEDIISLGFLRILTSGQAANAQDGAELIAKLIRQAAGRIIIMPGGGINEDNVSALIRITEAMEIHASLRTQAQSKMLFRNSKTSMGNPGHDEYAWMETDPEKVRKVVKMLPNK